MHSAGKRITLPPLRYDPSVQYLGPILPAIGFDLTMSGLEDANQSLPVDTPPFSRIISSVSYKHE